MGVDVYTLRKGGSCRVGGLGRIYFLRYLTKSNDLDYEPWERRYGCGQRATLLRASMERAERLFEGPVYYVYDPGNVGPDRGAEVRFCPDASKVSVWYDCDRLPGESVRRLSRRVKRGREVFWTLMTQNEQVAWEAEKAALEARSAEEGRRRWAETQQRREQEQREEEARRRAAASLDSAGL